METEELIRPAHCVALENSGFARRISQYFAEKGEVVEPEIAVRVGIRQA